LDRGQLYRLCRSAEEAAPLMVDFFRYFDPIHWLVFLVLRFRGSSHIDTSINLVLRSALLRASRRTATSETEPAAILRDGSSRLLRMRSVGSARSDWFSWNRSTIREMPPVFGAFALIGG